MMLVATKDGEKGNSMSCITPSYRVSSVLSMSDFSAR